MVGLDPSLNNWGWAQGILDHNGLHIPQVGVIQPVLPGGKQVRQNSKDVEAAKQLFTAAYKVAKMADVVFVEVPVGSQSARAMASYGICAGVLGGLRAMGVQFIEVNPIEVKVAATGSKTATKSQMITWAVATHPEAAWPTHSRCGKSLISEGKAEHMADAMAAIYAGLNSNPFQQLLPLFRQAA